MKLSNNVHEWLTRFATNTDAVTSTQVALGCCGLALALTLVLGPTSDNIAEKIAGNDTTEHGIDQVVTGSVEQAQPSGQGTVRYTIRRSVLQSSPNATCKIYEDGRRVGDC